MDILMNASVASNVDKTPLGMLELDWEGYDRGLRIKHQKHKVDVCWLKLKREDVDKLSRMILDCLVNHSINGMNCGNYHMTIDAELSKEDSLQFEIIIHEEEDIDFHGRHWKKSFDSYIGGINLLEGIHEFRRLYYFDKI